MLNCGWKKKEKKERKKEGETQQFVNSPIPSKLKEKPNFILNQTTQNP